MTNTFLPIVAEAAFNLADARSAAVEACKRAGKANLDNVRYSFKVGYVARLLMKTGEAGGEMLVALEKARDILANDKKHAFVNRASVAVASIVADAGLTDTSKGAGRKPRTPEVQTTAMAVIADATKRAAVAAIVPEVALASIAPKDASTKEARQLARRLASVIANAQHLVGADSRWADALALFRDIAGPALAAPVSGASANVVGLVHAPA